MIMTIQYCILRNSIKMSIDSKYVKSFEQGLLYLQSYETVLINHPHAVAIIDPYGFYMGVSKEMQNLFGRHIEVGKNILDAFPELETDTYHGPNYKKHFSLAISGTKTGGRNEFMGVKFEWTYYPIEFRPDIYEGKFCVYSEVRKLEEDARVENNRVDRRES